MSRFRDLLVVVYSSLGMLNILIDKKINKAAAAAAATTGFVHQTDKTVLLWGFNI